MKIKVEFKGKIHNIGTQISSIKEIIDGIKLRYPNQFKNGILLKIGDKLIDSFDEIITEWKNNKQPSLSIKISAFQNQTDIQKQQWKNNTFKYFNKTYKCWKCKKQQNLTCPICDGKGELPPNHPFMEFCSEIIQDKLNEILSQLGIQNIIKENKSEQLQFNPADLKAKFFSAPSNQVNSVINTGFKWGVSLINNGSIAWPKQTSVYRLSTGESIQPVENVQPQKSININLNLKSNSTKGIFVNQFRLGYPNGNSTFYFGPKFGFQLTTIVQEIKKMSPEQQYQYEMIKIIKQSVKYVSHQKHDVNFIVQKMKQFGVSTSSDKDFVIDIILQLQEITI